MGALLQYGTLQYTTSEAGYLFVKRFIRTIKLRNERRNR